MCVHLHHAYAQRSTVTAGKPHPKWAEPNFCDGDANEKWHSRSSRRLQYQKVGRDRHDDGQHLQGANGRGPPAIKTEQASDPSQQNLYRFTPSPTHPTVDGSSGHSYGLYRNQQAHGHGQGVYSPADDSSCYSSPSSASVITYSEARHGAHGVSNGDHYYQEQAHQQYVQAQTPQCACLTNPAAGTALIGLTSQLQNTAALLRQLPEHATTRQSCAVVRRVTELNDIMQYVPRFVVHYRARGVSYVCLRPAGTPSRAVRRRTRVCLHRQRRSSACRPSPRRASRAWVRAPPPCTSSGRARRRWRSRRRATTRISPSPQRSPNTLPSFIKRITSARPRLRSAGRSRPSESPTFLVHLPDTDRTCAHTHPRTNTDAAVSRACARYR